MAMLKDSILLGIYSVAVTIRRVVEWLGWFVLVLWIFGVYDVIDFHICIKGPGECLPP